MNTSSNALFDVASPLTFDEGVQEQEVLVSALAADTTAELTITEGARSYTVSVTTLDPMREPASAGSRQPLCGIESVIGCGCDAFSACASWAEQR